MTLSDKSELISAARFASRFFRTFINIRARHNLDYDELIIFFALGRLNFDPSQAPMRFVKPTNIVSLAEFVSIPRETLRRKLVRLEEKDLVQRTSYGFVVKDLSLWRRISEIGQVVAEVDA